MPEPNDNWQRHSEFLRFAGIRRPRTRMTANDYHNKRPIIATNNISTTNDTEST
jgi:hypothetical protein